MCSDRSGRTRADWVLFIARDWAKVIGDEHQCAMKQASELGDFDQKSKNMLIALGSNATLGGMSPDTLIRAAIEEMQSQTFMIRSVSRLYLSPAFPAGSGPDYVNAVVSAKSTMTPLEALSALHAIEAKFGRQRGLRWAPRTMDLDLLAVESRVSPSRATQIKWRKMPLEDQMRQSPDRLILPHPRIQDRAFVLVPMADVAPDWRHPVLFRTVRQMLDALPPEDVAALQPV